MVEGQLRHLRACPTRRRRLFMANLQILGHLVWPELSNGFDGFHQCGDRLYTEATDNDTTLH